MEYLDLLLNEGKKYLRDAMPGGSLNREWTPARVKKAGSAALDFVPVVGGIKGAKEEVLLDRAKKRGETPTEVLDQFIRGVRPLAVGGATAGLGYGLLDGGVSPD